MAKEYNVNINSDDSLRNNYDLMLEDIIKTPARIWLIGEELLKRELAKGKTEEGKYKSELLRIPIEEKQFFISSSSCDALKNNYELVFDYIKQDDILFQKPTIDIMGEKLLKEELAKGKNEDGSYKSELLKFATENDKVNILPDSCDFMRNSEELVKLNLRFNPGDIGIIGEELYQREVAKGKKRNGTFKSDIINEAIISGNFEIYQESIDALRNNEEFIKLHLECHPSRINAIGEQLLNKELQKGKDNEGKFISDILRKLDDSDVIFLSKKSPEYLKNNEEVILMYYRKVKNKFDSIDIGIIGEELFNKELEKGKDEKGNYKSKILRELFIKRTFFNENSPTYIRNNKEFFEDLLLNDINHIEAIGEELFNSEISKGKTDDGNYNSSILNLLVEKDNWNLTMCPNFLKNNLEIVLLYLGNDPDNINGIGEELFKNELEKGKDEDGHYKSQLLTKLSENKNWTLSKYSPEFLKNNQELIMMQIYRNPGEIETLDEEMLKKELAKGKDDKGNYKSEILNVIVKSGALKIESYSSDFIRNNEELIFLYLQQNPGKIEVIGEKLLEEELKKGKDENGYYKSRILKLLQEGKTINFSRFFTPPKYIINNEEIIQMYLEFNKMDKIIVGDELLIKELEKGKNGNGDFKSTIIQKIVESKKYTIDDSNDFAKNNEELFLIHLQANPGEISVIGELLLKQEIEKGKNEKGEYNSKILSELVRSKKCKLKWGSNSYINNNEEMIKIFLNSEHNDMLDNKITFRNIGDELLKKELSKGKKENGDFESEIINKIINSEHFKIEQYDEEFIRNDEKLFLVHLRANPGYLSPIGEELFKNEIQKGKNNDGTFKSEILELFRKHPQILFKSDDNRFLFNNADIMSIIMQISPFSFSDIEEELFERELAKGMINENTFKSDILQLAYERKSDIFESSCKALRTNEKFVLNFLRHGYANLDFLDEEFFKKELDKKISRNRNNEFEFESPIVEAIILQIINNPRKTIPPQIKNNEKLMTILISINVQNFGVIGKNLYEKWLNEKTPQNKRLIDYINKNYVIDNNSADFIKNDKEFVMQSLIKSINSFNFIGDELLTKELVESENSDILKYLIDSEYEITNQTPDRIKKIESICDLSLKNNINSFNSFNEQAFIEKMKKGEKFLNELKRRGFYLTEESYKYINSNIDLVYISIDNNIGSFCNISNEILQNEYEELELNGTSELFERLANNLVGVNKEDVFNTIKQLHSYNEDVLSTFNMQLLQNKYLGIRDKLNIIAPYLDIQSKIIQLNEYQYTLFEKLLNETSKQSNDYKDLIGSILDGLTNPENGFEKLNLQFDKNIKSLTDEQLRKLIYLYTSKNYFNIEDLNELDRYSEIKNKICDEIINNPDTEKIENLKEINCLNNRIDRMKFALLQKAYGIGLDEAEIFISSYGETFDGYKGNLTPEESTIYKQIKVIKGILDINNSEIIKQAYNKIEVENIEMYMSKSLQTRIIRNFITKRYNEKLFKIEDISPIDKVKHDDKEIPVYNAGTNFNMLIHAVGAYSQFKKPEDYKEYWNMPKTAVHGFCTSYIGNDMLGTARTQAVIYGFNNLEEGEFIVSAPWDLVSRIGNDEFNSIDIMEKSGNVSVRLPENQKKDTRHTHNETVLERNILVNGKLIKKQPDYLVYIADKFESTDEINDENWEETKKAASQFGIPIVIIDRSLCAENERNTIEQNIKLAKKTNDIQLLIDSSVKAQSNIAGYRNYHEDIREQYFDEKFVKSILDTMIQSIETIREEGSTENAKKCIEQLFLYEKQELKRWLHTRLNDKRLTGYNHEEFLIKLQEQMAYVLRDEKEHNSEIEWKTELCDILYDSRINEECSLIYDYIKEEQYKSQEGIDEIPLEEIKKLFNELNIQEQIQDIRNTNLYNDRQAHSIRHIQDVTLFGAIIGKLEGLNNNELRLLIEACKYHDSGRLDDLNSNHAEASQRIAKIMLEKQYNEKELGIIRAVIDFHESPEEDIEKFKVISDKFGLENTKKAYKIAQILKDADALDRTRFINKARLKVSDLRTKTSKKLIPLSCKINEMYAIKDLEKILENANETQRNQIEEKVTSKGALATITSLKKGDFVPKEKNTNITIEDYKEICDNEPNVSLLTWENYILSNSFNKEESEVEYK